MSSEDGSSLVDDEGILAGLADLGPAAVFEGTGGDDVIDGTEGDDDISGLGGNDTINGLGGDDNIAGGGGMDVLDGGEGIDTNDFSDISAPVVASIGAGLASYEVGETTIVESFSNFENLTGTDLGDQLSGDGGANVLDGNDGDDFLSGGGGDDMLLGGEGDDTLQGGGGSDYLDGGEGTDTADFSDIGSPVEVELAAGTASYEAPDGADVEDHLEDIENVTGTTGDDIIIGDRGNNLLAGNLGNDQIEGGRGNDIIRGDEIGDGTAITVTVENLLEEGGTFQTPVWIGFHDGSSFDLFNAGSAASEGLERIAEDGTIAPIAAEFLAQTGDAGVDSTVFGPAGPIGPGAVGRQTVNVSSAQGQGFFTWASMVIPSNDAFLSVPDDPLADPIFDEDGNFLGPLVIERSGADVLDAGTEVNTELDAAFLNQTAPDTGIDEGGVVATHPGFNGSVGNPILVNPGTDNILGGTTAAGAVIDPIIGDFTIDPEAPIFRITIDQLTVEGGDDQLSGGRGADIIEGGGGNDQLDGGRGRDTLDGGTGNDQLDGGRGADMLDGGEGEDLLDGDRGADILDGGAGDDQLEGGRGADTFVFIRGTGEDTVIDFGRGNDEIDVSDFGFGSSAAALSLASQDGDDVVVDLDSEAGDRIILAGINLDDLESSDFIV